MPNNIVKSFADKTGKSISTVEKDWDKAKDIAAKAGEKDNYPYITGVLKKMIGIESISDLFLKSGYSSFDKFLEDLTSGSIPQINRPEIKFDVVVIGQPENDKTINNTEELIDEDLLINKNDRKTILDTKEIIHKEPRIIGL